MSGFSVDYDQIWLQPWPAMISSSHFSKSLSPQLSLAQLQFTAQRQCSHWNGLHRQVQWQRTLLPMMLLFWEAHPSLGILDLADNVYIQSPTITTLLPRNMKCSIIVTVRVATLGSQSALDTAFQHECHFSYYSYIATQQAASLYIYIIFLLTLPSEEVTSRPEGNGYTIHTFWIKVEPSSVQLPCSTISVSCIWPWCHSLIYNVHQWLCVSGDPSNRSLGIYSIVSHCLSLWIPNIYHNSSSKRMQLPLQCEVLCCYLLNPL